MSLRVGREVLNGDGPWLSDGVHYSMSVACSSPCRCSPCRIRVAESPSNLFPIWTPRDGNNLYGRTQRKNIPSEGSDVTYQRSGPGVTACSHRTTILDLVANQIKSGRVVLSSLILSLSLRVFCREGGATAWDDPVSLATSTILSRDQPTISCKKHEKYGTLKNMATRSPGPMKCSITDGRTPPCVPSLLTVANRALNTPCRIWVFYWSSRLTSCVPNDVWVAMCGCKWKRWYLPV